MEYTRFEQLLRSRGVTVYQVSKATGIAASTFSDWKNGRSVPKANKLARIADFFSVSMDDLLGTSVSAKNAEAVYRAIRASKMVPVVREIRFGAPVVTTDSLIAAEFADVEEAEDYFYLEACDDSMRGRGIVCGTRVLFRRSQAAENGNIVAFVTESGSAAIRIYEKKNRRILLSPAHPDIAATELSTEDLETGFARILGVAVEAKTKF